MNYREKGELFCSDINSILKLQDLPCALVTGGGFAYDSIKYNDDQKKGDYDFMIVYQDIGQVESLIKSLSTLEFDFEKKYLDLDMELLRKSLIDIIRLSGKYKGTKSTINLVPVSLIDKVVNLEQDIVIKKIAHNRNTGLFFAYGSDNSRIIVNFLSPSFVTADGEDHYIHLDFTNHVLDNNIYLGILSDAILKGFNKNFDTINFQNRRMKMLQNINDFFRRNKIDNTNFINLFANHNYFPKYLKERLLEELNGMGKNSFQSESVTKEKTPIIMTTNFDSNFIIKPFNFINSKQYQGTFKEYISKMQNLEYDRQYLIDALAKFFGYVLFSNKEVANSEEIDNIIDKLEVYGMNDLYMEKIECYSINSIFLLF